MNEQDMQQREDIYRSLATLFYPPEKQWLLQENFFDNLKNMMKFASFNAQKYSQQMQDAGKLYEIGQLQVVHAKLFVGPFELLAPPYGSIYLESEKRIMGDSTMAVKEMYQKYGLQIADDFKDLPDHIAVELEFMNFLIHQSCQSLNKNIKKEIYYFINAQYIFLNQFLMKFVPPFCDRIKQNTDNLFYEALANCLFAFIKNEYDLVTSELEMIS